VTSDGYIKRLSYDELLTSNRKVSAIGLHKDASLIFAADDDGRDIILFTHLGKTIRFSPSGVRAMGRVAAGVKAMELEKGDYIIRAEFVSDDDMIFVASGDLGKKFKASEIRKQSRAGKGLLVWSSPSLAKIGCIDRAGCFSGNPVFVMEGMYGCIDASQIPDGSRDSAGEECLVPGDMYRLFV
jgi:DNA gyrase subunit A